MYHLWPARKKTPLSYQNPQAESTSNRREAAPVSLKFLIEYLMHLRRRLWSNISGIEKPNEDPSMQVLLKLWALRGGVLRLKKLKYLKVMKANGAQLNQVRRRL
jgi:hypothetical protein